MLSMFPTFTISAFETMGPIYFETSQNLRLTNIGSEDILHELLLLLLSFFLKAQNMIIHNIALKQRQTYSKETLTWPSMKKYKALGCTHLIGYILSFKCETRMINIHYTSYTRIVTPTLPRLSKLLHPCNQIKNVENMWIVFPLWFCNTQDDHDAPRNSNCLSKHELHLSCNQWPRKMAAISCYVQ
jgi:hypothetical protein